MFHTLGAVCEAAKGQEMKLIPVLILFRDCPLANISVHFVLKRRLSSLQIAHVLHLEVASYGGRVT